MPHNLDAARNHSQSEPLVGWDVAGRAPWPMKRLWREWTRPRIAVHSKWWLPTGVTMAHLFLTAVMGSFVFTFLDKHDTFHTGFAYRWFAETWPYTERGWGHLFILPFAVGVVGLFVRKTWWRTRLVLATLLGLAHVSCALAFLTSNPVGEFWQFMTLCAALAIWRILAEGCIKWPTF